jgi:hypothetical protein
MRLGSVCLVIVLHVFAIFHLLARLSSGVVITGSIRESNRCSQCLRNALQLVAEMACLIPAALGAGSSDGLTRAGSERGGTWLCSESTSAAASSGVRGDVAKAIQGRSSGSSGRGCDAPARCRGDGWWHGGTMTRRLGKTARDAVQARSQRPSPTTWLRSNLVELRGSWNLKRVVGDGDLT